MTPRLLLPLLTAASATAAPVIRYQTQRLTDQFFAEGATYADVNKDGKSDIIYGPHWYAGPEWKERHEIYKAEAFLPDNQYSKNFVSYTQDLNGDSWPDYLVLGFPGDWAYWFENPKGKDAAWTRHNCLNILDNESPTWGDLTGDGKPEIICSSGGYFGFASPDWADPTKEWVFNKISNLQVAGGKFTHGLGFGDVNGDGRADLLEKNGWFEQPTDPRTEWKRHEFAFSKNGGAQMFAYDFDGDGDNDVLTSEFAHGYGLFWFENSKGADGTISFQPHRILGRSAAENPQGVYFSQLHAVDLVDITGDGVKDIITGKRFFAHGSKGDEAPLDPPVLYWFEVQPGKKSGQAAFVAHFIDDNSGVGTQVAAADVTGDGIPDMIVGNKKGCHVSVARKVETDGDGFESIFDGQSLAGWDGDTKFWSVKDGAIVGESTASNPLSHNTFLLWKGSKLADFELRLKFRLSGDASANSGVQFRCQDEGNFDVKGYQADMDRGGKYLGCLWDEDGRGMLGDRGTESTWTPEGKKDERRTADRDAVVKGVDLSQWNEYTIIARSDSITLKINGQVTAHVKDDHTAERELYGLLALQLHAGPPAKIEWKDIRLKRDLP